MHHFHSEVNKFSVVGTDPSIDYSLSEEGKHRNKAKQSAQFHITMVCKNNTQDAPKCAIFHSSEKKFSGGGTNTKTKHSNQYNFRLLQSVD